MNSLETLISFAWMNLSGWHSIFPDYPAAGVLGPMIPDEIILAKGLQPVRLLHENLDSAAETDPGFPPYVYVQARSLTGPAGQDPGLPQLACTQARALAGSAGQDRLKGFKEIVVSQSCDALQAAADVLRASGAAPPVTFLKTPQLLSGGPALRFYSKELAQYLGEKLEQTGAEQLSRAVFQVEHRRRLVHKLYNLISTFTFREFYSVLRALSIVPYPVGSGFLEDLLAVRQSSAGNAAGPAGPIVILCGTHLPGKEVLVALDEAGFIPAGDLLDLGLCGCAFDAETGSDEFTGIASRFLERVPPPGKYSPGAPRHGALLDLVRSTGATGVVWYRQPFCDPVGFDIAITRGVLDREGIPSLCIDYESASDTGRISTRLEAFAEMIMGSA